MVERQERLVWIEAACRGEGDCRPDWKLGDGGRRLGRKSRLG